MHESNRKNPVNRHGSSGSTTRWSGEKDKTATNPPTPAPKKVLFTTESHDLSLTF
ncbi:hypothetical protein V6Z12_D07G144400 [Gossypium hirsutum]